MAVQPGERLFIVSQFLIPWIVTLGVGDPSFAASSAPIA